MKTCTKCGITKELSEFHKAPRYALGVNSRCKVCKNNHDREHAKLYRKENLERVRASQKLWREKNKDSDRERQKEWYSKNSDYFREWRANNPDKARSSVARYRAAKNNAVPSWLSDEDHQKIIQIYKDAEELSKILGSPRHVDHDVPLQGENVCGLHVPWNLKIMPASDNISKGNRYNGGWES